MAEFCIAELGAVLGISTTSAKKLIGHALELRHRLPRLWAQVHSGRVPAWRARIVAEATIHSSPALTMDAARWVDAQVAAVAGRIGAAQLDRLVAETIKRFELAGVDPAADPEDGYLSVDPRHVTIDKDDVHYAGTLHLEADLDISDALDLDHALVHGAALQKALGSTESLDVRRAKALGDLARTQTALDLFNQGHRAGQDGDGLPAAREVVLHAHFDASTVGEQTVFGPTGRMEEGQRLVLLDQVQAWCGDSRTKITIKPVIDLQAELSTPAYEIPDRIREQVVSPRPHVRVPVVLPPGPWLRHRPRHRARPRRRDPGQTPTRSHDEFEPRSPVPAPPPAQDLHRLDLPHRSRPVSSSGPAPTATTTGATAPAPPHTIDEPEPPDRQ